MDRNQMSLKFFLSFIILATIVTSSGEGRVVVQSMVLQSIWQNKHFITTRAVTLESLSVDSVHMIIMESFAGKGKVAFTAFDWNTILIFNDDQTSSLFIFFLPVC